MISPILKCRKTVSILYEATRVWGDGNFEFQITITNNMEETIEGWEINFRLAMIK